MEKLQLRLVIGGLVIILLGFLYGMAHTLSVDHTPRMSLRDDYESGFAELADRGLDQQSVRSTLQHIETVNTSSIKYQRAIGAHTHAIYLGMLVIILGLFFNRILAGSRHSTLLAAMLGAGVVIYPLGLAAQAAGFILLGEGLALLGSLMIIASIMVLIGALFRARD